MRFFTFLMFVILTLVACQPAKKPVVAPKPAPPALPLVEQHKRMGERLGYALDYCLAHASASKRHVWPAPSTLTQHGFSHRAKRNNQNFFSYNLTGRGIGVSTLGGITNDNCGVRYTTSVQKELSLSVVQTQQWAKSRGYVLFPISTGRFRLIANGKTFIMRGGKEIFRRHFIAGYSFEGPKKSR